MRVLIVLLLVAALLAGALSVRAEVHPEAPPELVEGRSRRVCIEQPPGVIHCGNDSPISPVSLRSYYLPVVRK